MPRKALWRRTCRYPQYSIRLCLGIRMRWVKDEIDLWCDQWASQRRKLLGITQLEPKDRIGKLRSTLAAVREDRDGASQGTVMQNFPEVYTGIPLLVNRAWHEMAREWRAVIEAHYVYPGYRTKEKAAALEVTVALYWKHWTFGKNYIHSFVTCSTKYPSAESLSTQNTLNPLDKPLRHVG